MASSTQSTTNRIAGKKVEPGHEFEAYQEAQNQFLAINAEQQQALALQQQNAANMMGQTQLLGQAAEIMNVNPETQQILSNYGVSQPRSVKKSEIKRQGPTTITINNSTVNNNSGGPVPGRDLQIKAQSEQQGKFKAWLSGIFARQDAQYQQQKNEYDKQQSGLSRSANKMMRKMESIGKEIGKAMDPRRVAQSVSNPLMNLMKSIGFLVLAKRLPKFFKAINDAESFIRKKIKNIEKRGGIKKIIQDHFDIENKEGILYKIVHALYDDSGNGLINHLIDKISEKLTKAKETANRMAGVRPDQDPSLGRLLKKGVFGGVLNIRDWIKWGINWTGNFINSLFGGTAAKLAGKKESLDAIADATASGSEQNFLGREFLGKTALDDKVVQGKGAKTSWTGHGKNKKLQNADTMFGISDSSGNTKVSYDKYEAWAKKNNLELNDASLKQYLNEAGYAYTGESIILTQEVYKSPYRIFDSDWWLAGGKRCRGASFYPQLALSHDIIAEFKRDKDKGMRHILAYLQILYNSCGILRKGVLIFPEMINKIAKPELIASLKENKKDLIEIQICLHRHRLSGQDLWMYGSNGDHKIGSTTSRGITDYFKKINTIEGQEKFVSSGNEYAKEKLTVAGKDFTGKENQTVWNVLEISKDGLGKVFEGLTGTSNPSAYLSEQSQLNTQKALQALEANKGEVAAIKKWKAEETSGLTQAIQIDEEYEEQKRQLEAQRQELVQQTTSAISEFTNGYSKGDISSATPGVNMGEGDGWRLGGKKNFDGSTHAYIPGVTKIFGGDGTLTSNYKELRDFGVTKTNKAKTDSSGKAWRYHMGVDMNYGGGGVFYPLSGGTLENISTGYDKNKIVDIRNQDGTITRYRHITNPVYTQVGESIKAGGAIGDSIDHIHVEVLKDGRNINPLAYFKEKGKSVSGPMSSTNTSTSPAVGMGGLSGLRNLISGKGGPTYEEELRDAYSLGKRSANKISFSKDSEKNNQVNLKNLETISLRILESTSYLARTMQPLSELINTGFSNVVSNASSQQNAETEQRPAVDDIQMKQL